jgi:HNH endonuclease
MHPTECTSSSLEKLPSSVLAARLDELMTRERHCLAEALLHLAAFDRRRGYLELGYESLFTYCTERLKMSKGTAYRRTTSARLIARFPAILDYLRDGRLCTTALCDLREVLSEENHRELLERASGLNEEEIKLLAATLNPKAELTDSVRRAPVRQVLVIRPALFQTTLPSDPDREIPGQHATSSNLEPNAPPATASEESTAGEVGLTWMNLPPKPSEVEPHSGERYVVRMTVSKAFMDEFRQVRNALSHVVPGGKIEDVLRECMRTTRDVCERRMRGSTSARVVRKVSRSGGEVRSPQGGTASAASSNLELIQGTEVQPRSAALNPEPGVQRPPLTPVEATTSSIMEPMPESARSRRGGRTSRYIPVAVREEVFERDEGCCTFVGANGKRCRSTYQLQFHHKVPFARGGTATSENLTLHCARHNKHRAYEDYGASHMDRFVAAPNASPASGSGGGDAVRPERKTKSRELALRIRS